MYSHLLDRKYTWPILTIIDFDISPCPILRIVKPRYLHHDVTIHQKGTGSKIIEGSIIWRWRDLADSRIRSLAPVFERSSEVPRIEFLGYRVKRSRNPLLHNQERARKLIEMEKPVPCTKAMVQLEKRLRGITREREREREKEKKKDISGSISSSFLFPIRYGVLPRSRLVGWLVGWYHCFTLRWTPKIRKGKERGKGTDRGNAPVASRSAGFHSVSSLSVGCALHAGCLLLRGQIDRLWKLAVRSSLHASASFSRDPLLASRISPSARDIHMNVEVEARRGKVAGLNIPEWNRLYRGIMDP